MMKTGIVVSYLLFQLIYLSTAAAEGPSVARLSSLPISAQASVSAALARDIPEYHVHAVSSGFDATIPHQRLVTHFTAKGVELRNGNVRFAMTLRSYGYGEGTTTVSPSMPHAILNRVQYRRGALTEWYENGPAGLEQGFTISKPPGKADGQPLSVILALSGDLTATLSSDATSLKFTDPHGRQRLLYSGLTAHDATGKQLPAWLKLRAKRLLLQVADAGARYPLVIDPLVQAELTSSDGAAGDQFGWSVAVSNTTVVVGARNATVNGNTSQGAAYVFVKPANGWANMTQTAKLTASDGVQGAEFGQSVAINAAGNTIVVGAIQGGPNFEGAAYVFVEPATGWTNMTQTAELTASDSATCESFGASVSISGNTVVVGKPQFGCPTEPGSAYVFMRPASGWKNMTQTAKLTASDAASMDQFGFAFGQSVSISGNTILIGAPRASPIDENQGVAYIFVKPTSSWTDMTQTAELNVTPAEALPRLGFGASVSVSGTTALVGAEGAAFGTNLNQGAAYIFVEPASGWANMNPTAQLSASNGKSNDNFGLSVAISGKVAVVSATLGATQCPGVAYLFVEPTTGWQTTSKFAAELRASNAGKNACFGNSVAITGRTGVAGAPCTGSGCGPGAAYLYAF